MVLAHSLRDNGTKGKLVALFTPESLHAATINELKVIPLSVIMPASIADVSRPFMMKSYQFTELRTVPPRTYY